MIIPPKQKRIRKEITVEMIYFDGGYNQVAKELPDDKKYVFSEKYEQIVKDYPDIEDKKTGIFYPNPKAMKLAVEFLKSPEFGIWSDNSNSFIFYQLPTTKKK